MAHLIPVRGNISNPVLDNRTYSPTMEDQASWLSTGSPAYRGPPDKHSTTILSYPINVEGDPQQGHYISFYVRVQDKAKLRAFKEAKATIRRVEKLLAAVVPGINEAEIGGQFNIVG